MIDDVMANTGLSTLFYHSISQNIKLFNVILTGIMLFIHKTTENISQRVLTFLHIHIPEDVFS